MTNVSRISTLMSLVALTTALAACGGGGGGAGSPAPSPAPVPAPSAGTATIKLVSLQLKVTDVLATTKPSSQVAVIARDMLHRFADKATSKIMGTAFADDSTCGTLCQPAYPPASAPATQALTSKLMSGGVLASLSPVFANGTPQTSVPCDFTNVSVQVNSMWLLDKTSQNALVSLSVPTAVDTSTCALTYTTADYVIFGASGQVVPLTQNVTQDIGDLIPSGDQAFNTSNAAIYYSTSTQNVRELAIDPTAGTVVMTDLTTSSEPVWTANNHFSGQVAYNGTYLVANAKNFSGLVVYQKGTTAFQIVRDNTTGGGAYPFLNDQGQFIVNQNGGLQVLNTTTGAETPWSVAQAQSPYGFYTIEGRSGTVVMGDRCVIWDYQAATEAYIYLFPTTTFSSLPSTSAGASIPATQSPASINPSYARLSGNYAFCVNTEKSHFVRYDVTTNTGTMIDLDSLGYIASSFTMYTDRAYATVTNTGNSSVEYIEIDFTTGQATYLGTITTGAREVVNLVAATNT